MPLSPPLPPNKDPSPASPRRGRAKYVAMISIAVAIVFHALVPRYEVTIFREMDDETVRAVLTRIDRWTGNVEFRLLAAGGSAGSDGDWLTITR